MTTKQLIEDYERKIKTAYLLLGSMKKDGTEIDRFNRVTTKLSCYRTFLSELNQLKEVVDNTSY